VLFPKDEATSKKIIHSLHYLGIYLNFSTLYLYFYLIVQTMTTPCGLTRQELAAHNWLDNGMCNALFRNNNGDLQAGCGEPYASHPSSAQGKEHFFLLISFLHRA
jgi:hypothetical protein